MAVKAEPARRTHSSLTASMIGLFPSGARIAKPSTVFQFRMLQFSRIYRPLKTF
jgi:hypothetical protein